MQDAIENRHIKFLVDEYTNLLIDNIPVVMQYLFCNNRRVCRKKGALKENKVMNITWQHHNLIILLTHSIENLQKLVQQASIPYTDQHLVKNITAYKK